MNRDFGFSLIEVLVVTTVIAVVSTVLILNFRPSTTNEASFNRAASLVVADFRKTQSEASSLVLYGGQPACGYGIHYVDKSTYIVYAGLTSGGASCASSSRGYQSSIDATVETKKLINDKLEFRSSFKDIFFEPPDPKTYLQNDASPGANPETITIIEKGGNNCTQAKCIYIDIYTSGRIEIRTQ
ncbi:MAG: prepilin-type N-terminal cleavage/methylation domain-containing protein [bacterium]|nr:prepilin-type N-terminal cleavage/methylation domain-containing protein [bacterium]